MPAKKQVRRKSAVHPAYNGWMFLRDFAKGIIGLLNSGKIYPAFGLVILGLMGLVLWRMPQGDLSPMIRDLLLTVRSSFGWMLFLFLVTNLTWAWLFHRQREMHADEVRRLTAQRHELMHGLDPLIPIRVHRSSEDVQRETHIYPVANNE